jgi:hypothetical protein
MQYMCDTPDKKTWFRLETEYEADQESVLMEHGVEKHFRRARECACLSHKPTASIFVEQDIGLKAHIMKVMPLFLTLRDSDGNGLATAMLPPEGVPDGGFRKIIVSAGNTDPYPKHETAIRALGNHFGITLDRASCYPYKREQPVAAS